MQKASIVIPVFNNLAYTLACLESIAAHTDPGTYDVIVVDNGSTDGTEEALGKRSDIRYIRNTTNLFFARGCNRGAEAATHPILVFLNNDTVVKPAWLAELVRSFESQPRIGIAGNKQVFPANHPCANRVWHAGMVFGEDKLPWHVFYGFDADHPLVNQERECLSVSGCCIAIRKDLFEQSGGFDAHFQNGFEDVDFCLRARERGFLTVYAPRSEIVHFVSRTEGRFDRETENRKKFLDRWSARVTPDEIDCYRRAGLLPAAESRSPMRIGFISSYNQAGATSQYAERLLSHYPAGEYVVLAEFSVADRRADAEADAPHVVRCWDRTGTWYYPLLRWATALDLDLIHVNFDAALFPAGFLELLAAARERGKKVVLTVHPGAEMTALARRFCQLADAVVTQDSATARRLIGHGVETWKLHIVPPAPSNHAAEWKFAAEGQWDIYRAVLSRAVLPRGVRTQPHLPRVRWEGPQMVNHSFAVVNRELESAILDSKMVELAIRPVGVDTFATSVAARVRTLTELYHRALSGPAEVHVRHQWPPDWSPPVEGRWVVIQPWEYGGLPEEWVAEVNRAVDEVWAPSTFVRDLYVHSGVDASRVQVVPNGVDADLFRPGLKPYALDCRKSLKFLFVGGTIHRKGIDILLEAYLRAFGPADDVALIIKDSGVDTAYRGQGLGAEISRIQKDGNAATVVYLNKDLTDTEMARLYNACNCLVHPYRGEGFGLPVLEAMACGLPVVVTAGGATDDFVDDATGFRVPAEKRVFGRREISGLKTVSDLWMLEPDPKGLAELLKAVAGNRRGLTEMGQRARAKVVDGWTWKHAAARAIERIQVLREAPILRSLEPVDAAVLVDMPDDVPATHARRVVESLERSSYAKLKVFLRSRADEHSLSALRSHPGLEILSYESIEDTLNYIRTRARAPMLVVVTEPLRFSKHWPKQLREASDRIGKDAKIVWPARADDAPSDEYEFQKAARAIWRTERENHSERLPENSGCIAMSWECLTMIANQSITGWKDCAATLTSAGVRSYEIADTVVGRLPRSHDHAAL